MKMFRYVTLLSFSWLALLVGSGKIATLRHHEQSVYLATEIVITNREVRRMRLTIASKKNGIS